MVSGVYRRRPVLSVGLGDIMTRTKAQWDRTEGWSELRAGAFTAYAFGGPDNSAWGVRIARVTIRSGSAKTRAKAEAAALRSLRAIVCRAWRDLMIDVQETP